MHNIIATIIFGATCLSFILGVVWLLTLLGF
ncbi:hypothetical protein bas02_0084 [Veterinaerplatzvirus Jeanpiccard]|uniref:Uncharacterized protein n=1 Tax=Escherichia phage JeanPiccard TaxID=2851955 RepID=A0AAE8B207_9CAUD|nr:hypothetical protein bas02_0084 [Escherichia phage JeanPiccard]